jgi:hypothetical protein
VKKGAFRLPDWWRRFVVVAPFALVLLYAVAAVSFAAVASDAVPARVLPLYPANGPALSALAKNSLLEAEGTQLAQAHASSSLMQSPIGPEALRTLALVSELRNDRARAAELMSSAFSFDRRDLGISLWMIEEHVRRGDVPGALRHYDIALRISRRAQDVLFPVLIEAAENQELLPQLAGMIGQGTAWADPFGDALIESDIQPEAKVALADRLSGKPSFGAPFREKLVANLVGSDEFILAAQVAGRTRGYDPVLEAALNLPAGQGPFEWKLANGYQVETAVEERDGRPYLYVSIDPEFRDSPARVLLTLPPGRYRLAARSADPVAGVRSRWQVACAQAGGAVLTELAFGRGRSETTFAVPGNCYAQRLSLQLSSIASSPDDVQIEVSELSLVPLDRPQR